MPKPMSDTAVRLQSAAYLDEKRKELIFDITSLYHVTPDKLELMKTNIEAMLVAELVQRWISLYADELLKRIDVESVLGLVAEQLRNKFVETLRK